MAISLQIEASLAGQALAQRGVDLHKAVDLDVRAYDQMRRGRLVHVSGYSRHMIMEAVRKLKAGQTIEFPDGQKVKLAIDGRHLISVDKHGNTKWLAHHGEHRTSAGAARVADHVIGERTNPDTGIFGAWEDPQGRLA